MDLRIASTWDGHPVGAGEVVTVRLSDEADRLRIDVDALLHGDPPPTGPPGSREALWEHEVVEIFVAGPPADGVVPYTEVEMGPWGHYLVLQLHGVRHVVARGLPLDFHVERTATRWHATARLDRALLPAEPHCGNAYAIHGTDGARRYLAWHPVFGKAADFHQPNRFVPMPWR